MADARKLGLGKPAPTRNPVLDNLPKSSFQQVGQPTGQAAQKLPVTTEIPEGITGALPLPIGQPVFGDIKRMLPEERVELEALGWKDGDPIPANMADLIAAAKEEGVKAVQAASDLDSMPPPAAPDLPPLAMPEEINITQLPEHRQRELKMALQDAGNQAELLNQARARHVEGAGPGVQAAAEGQVQKVVEIPVEYDKGPPGPASSGTGVNEDTPKMCPHCNWDQAMPDPIDPSDADKQTFLQCVLGGLPWKKVYSLLDDKLAITIRQLAPVEVDACYEQTHAERHRGMHQEPSDFYEQLLRYRMCLQLVDVRNDETLIPFPDSMDAWEGSIADPDPTTLPQIMKDVYAKVIHTESINRIMSSVVAQFNRLVSKLEVNVESPDFWKETKSPA